MKTASRVIKNTAILSLGQFVTLVLGMVFTALLSRHIGPQGYGQYTFAQSLVALLMVFVNLGFDTLTVRSVAQQREQASQYFVAIASMKTVFTAIILSLFLIVVLVQNNFGETTLLVLLVAAAAFLDSLTQTAGSIFFAFERMEYHVVTEVVRAVLALGLGAGAISLGFNLLQITAALILANALRAVLSFGLLAVRITRPRLEVDLGLCKQALTASLPFALLIVVNVVSSNVNVIMLKALDRDIVVGWYGSALRLVNVLLIAPNMFLQSIYPVLSRFYVSSKRSLAQTYSKAYEWGLVLGLPLAAGVFLLSDHVVSLVFGPGFENASGILRILTLVVAVSFCNNVNGATLNAIGRERVFAAISTGAVLAVAAVSWALIPRFSYIAVAVTQDIGTGLGFLIYSFLCHRWLKLVPPWRTALKALAATSLMILCVHLALNRIAMGPLAAALLVGPAVYAAALYVLRAFSAEDVGFLRRAISGFAHSSNVGTQTVSDGAATPLGAVQNPGPVSAGLPSHPAERLSGDAQAVSEDAGREMASMTGEDSSGVPKVVILTLNWNGRDSTLECVASLKSLVYPNYEIVVVDNGSADGSVPAFRARFPDITIIENGRNLGYAQGFNTGLRFAAEHGADYFLILNNDTVMDKWALKELVRVAEADPQIGFVSGKVYFYDEPSLLQTVGRLDDPVFIVGGHLGYGELDQGQYDAVRECDFVDDVFLLVNSEILEKVGGYDPTFFLMYEETDWCARVRRAGYKIVYTPDAKVWHKGNRDHAGGMSPTHRFYLARNQIPFMRRNASPEQFRRFLLALLCSFKAPYAPRQTWRFLKRRQFQLLSAYWRGIGSGLLWLWRNRCVTGPVSSQGT